MDIKKIAKKVEPFVAIGVFIMLVLSVVGLYNYNSLQKEININCGWGEDNYECICEKSEVIEMRNQLEIINNQINLSLDQWD